MIGPTGVGKTEISRRLAKLAQAPFIKVEASKFTEVGYVGRDVESIIRDLTDIAVNMVKEEEKQKVEIRAREVAEERVLDLLLPAGEVVVEVAPGVYDTATGGRFEVCVPPDDVADLRTLLAESGSDLRLEDLGVAIRSFEVDRTR